MENSREVSQNKQTNIQQQKTPEIPYDPAISPLGIYLKKIKTLLLKDTFTSVFEAALFTMKMWCVYTHTHRVEYYSAIKEWNYTIWIAKIEYAIKF